MSPDGWLLRDFGPLDTWGRIVRIRADRAAAGRLFLVAESWGGNSVVRLDLAHPDQSIKIELPLEAAQLKEVFQHQHFEPLDVAATARHILVLGEVRGKSRVMLWTNDETPRYLQYFNAGERSTAIRALASGKPETATYFCLLPEDDRRTLRIWEYNARYAGSPTAGEVGDLPPPKTAGDLARFGRAAALANGSPEHPDRLYVLDSERRHVRLFDVRRVVQALRNDTPLENTGRMCAGDVAASGGEGSLDVGAGQVLHVADPDGYALRSYERTP
jgi:hypothetical protein